MLPITDPHNVNVSDWSITAMSTWPDGKFTECFYWGNWGVQYSTQWILHSKVVMWCICLFMSSFKPHHNDSIAWIYVSCIGKVKVGVSKAENLPRLQFCRVRCHGAAALMLLLPLWTTSLPCFSSCELKNTFEFDRSKLLSFSLNNPFPLQYISICLFACSILLPPPCSSSFLNWSLSVFAFLTPALRNHLQVHCRSQVPQKLLKISPSPTHPCSLSMDMWVLCHI